MRKIILGFVILFCSCGKDETQDQVQQQVKVNGQYESLHSYSTIVYDSCEYIMMPAAYGAYIITHKGNCKFCRMRNVIHDTVYVPKK